MLCCPTVYYNSSYTNLRTSHGEPSWRLVILTHESTVDQRRCISFESTVCSVKTDYKKNLDIMRCQPVNCRVWNRKDARCRRVICSPSSLNGKFGQISQGGRLDVVKGVQTRLRDRLSITHKKLSFLLLHQKTKVQRLIMEYKSIAECPCQLICAFPKDWKGAKISTLKKSFRVERQRRKNWSKQLFRSSLPWNSYDFLHRR